jgi:CBS domain-containing protein
VDDSFEDALRAFAKSEGCVLAVNEDGLLKGEITLNELRPHLHDSDFQRLVTFQPLERRLESTDNPEATDSEPVPLLTPSDLVNPLVRVGEVMTTDPRTCSSASTALEATMIFRDADCGVVPITEEGRPIGVLTDRDVALALNEFERDLALTPVSRLMTEDPVTISETATLDLAMNSLSEHGLRRLMVIGDDDQLVGVLSWVDLIPHLSDRGLGAAVSKIIANRRRPEDS